MALHDLCQLSTTFNNLSAEVFPRLKTDSYHHWKFTTVIKRFVRLSINIFFVVKDVSSLHYKVIRPQINRRHKSRD